MAKLTAGTFSLFGPPKEIISDNGPQFTGQPYKDMCDKWAITHSTSSPRYPKSNGLVERMVKTVKNLIKKSQKSNQDVQLALLNLRITPIDSNLPSPAEILFGRPIRSILPNNQLATTLQCHEEMHQTLLGRMDKMKENHDVKKAGPELPPLHTGQKIRMFDQESKTWKPGTVTKVGPEPRSYEVTNPNGTRLRRNRFHLREAYSSYENKHSMRHQSQADQQQPSHDHKDPYAHRQTAHRQTSHEQTGGSDIQQPNSLVDVNLPRNDQIRTTRLGRHIRPPNRYGY